MTAYWISNLCELFDLSDGLYAFWPLKDNKNDSFNSLTRLIILVSFLSALLMSDNYETYMLAGVVSILFSVIIYYLTFNGAKSSTETYLFSEHSTLPGHHHHEKHDEDKKSKNSKKSIVEEEEEEEEPVENIIKTATGKIIKDTLPDLSLKNKKDSAKKEEFNDSVFVKGVRKNYDPKLLFNLK